jgi:hypothetical protein
MAPFFALKYAPPVMVKTDPNVAPKESEGLEAWNYNRKYI